MGRKKLIAKLSYAHRCFCGLRRYKYVHSYLRNKDMSHLKAPVAALNFSDLEYEKNQLIMGKQECVKDMKKEKIGEGKRVRKRD